MLSMAKFSFEKGKVIHEKNKALVFKKKLNICLHRYT